jgi:hypothetical protein
VLLIQIAGGLVLVVLILAFLMRGRLSGSSGPPEKRSKSKSKSDFRPTLPPSPYQPSRGFRILESSEPVVPHPVPLPHLDPNREFVFNDSLATPAEPVSPPHLRHDEKWALDRSMRHAPHPHVRRRRRLAWVVVILLLVVGLVAVLVLRHSPAPAHHSGVALAVAITMVPAMRVV